MKFMQGVKAIAFTLFIFSCAVDPEIEILGDCEDLDLADGYVVSIDTIMTFAPYFNPNNSDQFDYIEQKAVELTEISNGGIIDVTTLLASCYMVKITTSDNSNYYNQFIKI